MCGINESKASKKRGPKPREQEQIDDFLQSMMSFMDFGNANSAMPKLTMESAYKAYLKHQSNRFTRLTIGDKYLKHISDIANNSLKMARIVSCVSEV